MGDLARCLLTDCPASGSWDWSNALGANARTAAPSDAHRTQGGGVHWEVECLIDDKEGGLPSERERGGASSIASAMSKTGAK